MKRFKLLLMTCIILPTLVSATNSCTKHSNDQSKYLDESYIWSTAISKKNDLNMIHLYLNESIISFATTTSVTIKYPERRIIKLPDQIAIDHSYTLCITPKDYMLIGSLNKMFLFNPDGKLIDQKLLNQIHGSSFAYYEICDLINNPNQREDIDGLAYDLNANDNSYIHFCISIINNRIDITTIKRDSIDNYIFLGRGTIYDNKLFVLATPENKHQSILLIDSSSGNSIIHYRKDLTLFDNNSNISYWGDVGELLTWSRYVAIGKNFIIFPIINNNQRILVYENFINSTDINTEGKLKSIYTTKEWDDLMNEYQSLLLGANVL